MGTTKVRHVRLTLSPFSSEQMLQLGRVAVKSIQERIEDGKNAKDQDAKGLKGASSGAYIPYAEQKARKGLVGIRNWVNSGSTLRAMQVLSVNQNGGKIGFNNSHANAISIYLDKIEKSFALSPNDQKKLETELGKMLTARPPVKMEVE